MVNNSDKINSLMGKVPMNENGSFRFRPGKRTAVGLGNTDPTLIAAMGGYIESDHCKNTNEALRIFYVGLVNYSEFLNSSRNELYAYKKDYIDQLPSAHCSKNTTLLLHLLANICYINNLLA
jgi:hypothetical protein